MSSQRFEILGAVGAGNFGVIRRGVDHEAKADDNSTVAIKELKRPINLELLNREIKLQYRSQMTCANIVQLHHIIELRPNNKYLLVMELCPMDMRSFLTAFYCPHRASLLGPPPLSGAPKDDFQTTYGRRYVPIPYVKRLMAGLLNALASVHTQGIAHRDVKPENILVEPLGLAQPLRGVHEPSVVFACSSRRGSQAHTESTSPPDIVVTADAVTHDDAAPCGAAATRQPIVAVAADDVPKATSCTPPHVCVALQDGMTVEEIIASTRAIHCPRCHAQFAHKQPRLAALTAAALRTSQSQMRKAVVTLDSGKTADSVDFLTSAGTDTAAGATDSTPSDGAEHTHTSPLSDNEYPTTATSADWLQKATPFAAAASRLPSAVAVDARGMASPGASLTCPLRPEVKLGDFGSARDLHRFVGTTLAKQRTGLTGSPTTYVYCAPEMMLQQAYTTAVDVWAAGMILFELATGELLLRPGQLLRFDGGRQPNSDFSITYRLMRMIHMLGTPSAEDWAAIANPDLYPSEMLAALPQIRGSPLFDAAAQAAAEDHDGAVTSPASSQEPEPGAHKQESRILGHLLHDALGEDGVDLLRRLITYDPSARITAREALQHPFFRSA